MGDFRDLLVWQKACKSCVDVYQVAETFPTRAQFGLAEQIRRAGLSICTNIAEGWGRGGDREFARFLRIARGSANETHCCVLIAARLKFVAGGTQARLEALGMEVKKMLTAFLKRLGSIEGA